MKFLWLVVLACLAAIGFALWRAQRRAAARREAEEARAASFVAQALAGAEQRKREAPTARAPGTSGPG